MLRGVAWFALACLLLGVADVHAARAGCVCTAIYDPVCGKDGQDYSSACQADCAGVAVASKGRCEDTEQMNGYIDKADDCYCTKLYNPVCGEDAVTYQNECTATCAGASVKSDGECASGKSKTSKSVSAAVVQEDSPASPAGDTAAAAAAAAADITPPASADAAVQLPGPTDTGTTQNVTNGGSSKAPKLDCVCAALYQPVCGVDGSTYPNACEADCKGVDVATAGPCSSEVTTSDVGDAAAELPTDATTSKDPLISSANASLAEGCVCAAVFEPVCGDNGQDYSNACEADCAGVSVAHKGRCSSDSLPAGSGDNRSCVCPMMYAPVCTKKGATRSNKCMAECRGEKVAYEGPCKPKEVVTIAAAVTDEASEKPQPSSARSTNATTTTTNATTTTTAAAAGESDIAAAGNATATDGNATAAAAAGQTGAPAGGLPKGNGAGSRSNQLVSTALAALCFGAMLL